MRWSPPRPRPSGPAAGHACPGPLRCFHGSCRCRSLTPRRAQGSHMAGSGHSAAPHGVYGRETSLRGGRAPRRGRLPAPHARLGSVASPAALLWPPSLASPPRALPPPGAAAQHRLGRLPERRGGARHRAGARGSRRRQGGTGRCRRTAQAPKPGEEQRAEPDPSRPSSVASRRVPPESRPTAPGTAGEGTGPGTPPQHRPCSAPGIPRAQPGGSGAPALIAIRPGTLREDLSTEQ